MLTARYELNLHIRFKAVMVLLYLYIYIYVCVCVCVCVYLHRFSRDATKVTHEYTRFKLIKLILCQLIDCEQKAVLWEFLHYKLNYSADTGLHRRASVVCIMSDTR